MKYLRKYLNKRNFIVLVAILVTLIVWMVASLLKPATSEINPLNSGSDNEVALPKHSANPALPVETSEVGSPISVGEGNYNSDEWGLSFTLPEESYVTVEGPQGLEFYLKKQQAFLQVHHYTYLDNSPVYNLDYLGPVFNKLPEIVSDGSFAYENNWAPNWLTINKHRIIIANSSTADGAYRVVIAVDAQGGGVFVFSTLTLDEKAANEVSLTMLNIIKTLAIGKREYGAQLVKDSKAQLEYFLPYSWTKETIQNDDAGKQEQGETAKLPITSLTNGISQINIWHYLNVHGSEEKVQRIYNSYINNQEGFGNVEVTPPQKLMINKREHYSTDVHFHKPANKGQTGETVIVKMVCFELGADSYQVALYCNEQNIESQGRFLEMLLSTLRPIK